MKTGGVVHELLLKNTGLVVKATSCCSCFPHRRACGFMGCVAGEHSQPLMGRGELRGVDVGRASLDRGQ